MKKFGTYIVAIALLVSFITLNYTPAEAFHDPDCSDEHHEFGEACFSMMQAGICDGEPCVVIVSPSDYCDTDENSFDCGLDFQ